MWSTETPYLLKLVCGIQSRVISKQSVAYCRSVACNTLGGTGQYKSKLHFIVLEPVYCHDYCKRNFFHTSKTMVTYENQWSLIRSSNLMTVHIDSEWLITASLDKRGQSKVYESLAYGYNLSHCSIVGILKVFYLPIVHEDTKLFNTMQTFRLNARFLCRVHYRAMADFGPLQHHSPPDLHLAPQSSASSQSHPQIMYNCTHSV